jgi:hypothetical protein
VRVGRTTKLAAAPDGMKVAVASQDGRLRTIDTTLNVRSSSTPMATAQSG